MKRISSVVALTALALGYASAALAAGGVVGTGTPGSCTETAFDAVFAKAQTSGGGVISFNCGAMPHAIVFTVYKSVATNTEIQGGDLITLSGSNTTAVFQVSTLGTLKLGNLVITRGYSAAGAIENFGRLTVVDARLEGNTSIVNGGAISNHAEATLTNVVVTGNEALEEGGGLHSDGGTLTIRNSQITNNLTGAAAAWPMRPVSWRSSRAASRATRATAVADSICPAAPRPPCGRSSPPIRRRRAQESGYVQAASRWTR